MLKRSRGFVVVAMLALVALELSPAKAATGNLPLSLCAPGPNFTARPAAQANPYFPLTSAMEGVLVGPDGDETHGLEITLRGTLSVAGVTTRIVREFEWLDVNGDGDQDNGEPSIEDSDNYFAQVTSGPAKGTVCYFGEFVTHFTADGQPTADHSGSWRADGNPPSDCADQTPNAPGIFMPANPKPGMHFQQESAPCVALDVAQVVGVGTVILRNGRPFPNAIRVKEGSLLESGKEYKSYAPGPGLIIDDGLQLCSPGTDCPGA